jgi:hypothetical protein
MSNSTLKILPAIMVAIIAAWLTQPVYGGAVHQVVFTENSSTSLSVTFDGSTTGITVTSEGPPDAWSVTLPSEVAPNSAGGGWFEPENANLINLVIPFTGVNGFSFSVLSDLTDFPTGLSLTSNGGTINEFFVDTDDETFVSVTFQDNGDAATTVPETGSTFGLLFLSSIALLGATRLRSLQ